MWKEKGVFSDLELSSIRVLTWFDIRYTFTIAQASADTFYRARVRSD